MDEVKIDNLLVKCKDKTNGEEGYVELGLIGEAIIRVLIEDDDYNSYLKQLKRKIKNG